MADSRATGEGMASNGYLGGDVIRLAAGDAFAAHTHPGDHLLIVLAGEGTIVFGDTVYPTRAGELYMVDGGVPHAVGAITDHVILAVGAPHKPVDAPDRMTVLEYLAVAAEFPRLHCRLCDREVAAPALLHDVGCAHCPCPACTAAPRAKAGRP
jgi:mannose-6-phosphate isomerase-like protein (cupin superfamily)